MAPRPPLVALKNVRLQDGQRPLFDGVDIAVEPRTRAALVGRNGAGKSTLMKMVMGLIEPDAGDRSVQAGVRFAYVPQEPVITGETLLDYAASEGAERWTAEAWLATFGLDPEKPAVNLSGGEIRRAALAKAFAEEPDLLLLDEPTNHLDILAIELLEEELLQARFSVLVVSHDRAFLNRVTQSCHWLEGRRVRTLNKGFAAFDEWSTKVQDEEAQSLQRLTKTIERETETFYRSITARRTRNEGRARSLEALRADRSERLKDVPRELNLGVDSGATSGKLVAELKGVTKTFGDRTVIKPFTTRVIRGDRLAIVGPNGAGKTTLVKILLGQLKPDEGTVRLGANLEPVYLDQSREGLRSDMTLWDALTPGGGDSVLVRGISKHVAAYAKDFLFQEGQLRQPISTLSGGERNRLLLARALAKPANMLVLDEPTNDLDMDTLDKLEELLESYDGTLILVSHDRDFVDRLATSTIAMNGRGDIVETPGGWTDFIRQNPGFLQPGANPRPQDKDAARRAEAAPAPASVSAAPKKPGKLTFKDAHRLKELEGLLATLPADIARHEATLADPGLYARDRKAFDRATANADRARALLAAAEEEWLELEAKREALGV
ncbi:MULTISPECIES: ABC-F family ATP-binding cassette domain-containing protein [unclassified Brevundimonas]|uniref:ABC-F family ATP-binding cassette domain-containing protein n=1 Tax=unclassified Brevundimonas TaxID=2622653 RepID=UPI0006F3BF5A|nr:MULTISPECIES: ABC-F family ATP-binding cassette domain-containing protein [unclassified Brevundimonas]KQY70243.1 elongation factor 3 [Brevundimonas sp. Root1423]KRA29336.1 elongation factor 3 [Brevundimonas sp. Root608]